MAETTKVLSDHVFCGHNQDHLYNLEWLMALTATGMQPDMEFRVVERIFSQPTTCWAMGAGYESRALRTKEFSIVGFSDVFATHSVFVASIIDAGMSENQPMFTIGESGRHIVRMYAKISVAATAWEWIACPPFKQ